MHEQRFDLNLDVDPGVRARALHRVVRAMHDGHCPKCGHLGPSDQFIRPKAGWGIESAEHICPKCGFSISDSEASAALAEFLPYLGESVKIFEEYVSVSPSFPCQKMRYAGRELQSPGLQRYVDGTESCPSFEPQ